MLRNHQEQIKHQYKGIIATASNHDVTALVAFYYTIHKDVCGCVYNGMVWDIMVGMGYNVYILICFDVQAARTTSVDSPRAQSTSRQCNASQ